MTDQEFKALDERVDQGEKLSVLDCFLYRREKQRREVANIFQREAEQRLSNPLLKVDGK